MSRRTIPPAVAGACRVAAVLSLLWLAPGQAAAAPAPRDLLVQEEVSFVGGQHFLLSVELELRRSPTATGWRDTVEQARLELNTDGRARRYDSATDPTLVGTTWRVVRSEQGEIEIEDFSSALPWFDVALVRRLASVTAALPPELARKGDSYASPVLGPAFCDGPCVSRWTVELEHTDSIEIRLTPVSDRVNGGGRLVVDKHTGTLDLTYATVIGEAGQTTVLGRLRLASAPR